ncbi:ABC transporter permease [Bacillus pseudomycoides]|uniref:ABC transporter permease n=1 Tax=Bacillus pseudomycoides TaxID=64104 RepID=UPI000BEB80ED|nr:ABC transporter permease [Bacillus pseudomycoides]PEB42611.1 ABC transporter ATP-binding protein [Bacillus pseudomycoides]PGD92293.1 ABC transporter ATP-binding protein [Bacillus pseudomycoides]PGE04625.1 ABC transporter ATP-binding protein [Bacillus pseudomycoides]PHE64087.1 ABC transporter ATP-binding protein [Bacillus pseudomycoides]PHG17226.1 ABC transporter ATP-binding protein [Bacillus pseudomycoides]
MKSFIIAWKDLKIRLIDRRGFMMMLLMPLLLTTILGSALSNILDSGGLPKTVIGYYQKGTDEFANIFQKDVLHSKEIKDDVKIEVVASQKELEDLLRKQKIDVGMIIPNEWSEHIKDGKLKEPKLITDPSKDIQAKIAESLIRSFSERVQTVAVSTKTVATDLAKAQPGNIEQVAKEVSANLQAVAASNTDGIEKGTIGKKTVAAMQYYAAAMLVMFLLYNITVGAKSIITEQRTETLARLSSTPTSSFAILLGKFLGTLLFACIQFGVFVVATYYAFHVNWGEDVSQIVVVGIAYAICVSGLSMLIAAFIREEKTADLMGGIGIQLLAILGGSMLPIYAFPDTLQTIANIAPNKWALTSFLNIMSGTSWYALLPVILSLSSAGIASVIIGTFRLRTR